MEPGRYREVQNYIVDAITKEAVYTPPPPKDVPGQMEEFVEWLNKSTGVSAVLQAGISQFQFVQVHPFLDGNGRTARVLCTLILYQHGYDFKRLFSLSEYYDKGRMGYYEAIQSVRDSGGDMTGWLEYFTEGLRSQLLEVKARGEKAIKREAIVERARKLDLNDRQQRILMYILDANGASVEQLRRRFDLVRRTVQRDLSQMVEQGLIGETSKSVTDPTKHYVVL